MPDKPRLPTARRWSWVPFAVGFAVLIFGLIAFPSPRDIPRPQHRRR